MNEIEYLNVGGVNYATRRSTLCVKGSFFEALYSGKMKSGETINDALFIDRDGNLFADVLNYLRNLDEWTPPHDPRRLLDLINEAKFYCLDGMLNAIKKTIPEKILPMEISLRIFKDDSTMADGIYLCDDNHDVLQAIKENFETIPVLDEFWTFYVFIEPKARTSVVIIKQLQDRYTLHTLYETSNEIKMFFLPHCSDPIYETIRIKLGIKV